MGRPKRKPKGAATSLDDVKNVVLSLNVDWSEQSEGDEARFVKLLTSAQAESIVPSFLLLTYDGSSLSTDNWC